MESARKRGKGYRVSGGSIIGDISKGVSKASKSVSKAVTGAAKSVYKGALKSDVGGIVEGVIEATPKPVVKGAMVAGLIASGLSPEESEALADASVEMIYAYDFGSAPSNENMSNAAKAGVMSAIKAQAKGGALRDNKGIHHMAIDSAKGPITKGGSVFGKVAKSAAAKKVTKKLSNVAKVQSESRFDPNIEFAGKGFLGDMAKGAVSLASNKDVQALALTGAKEGYKAYSKNKKKKETSGGSMKDIQGRGFLGDMAKGAVSLASNKDVQKLALDGAKAGYSTYQKNKKKKETSGGSMKSIGSGAKRPAKGSAEAKAWGEKMRAAREAKKK
jgi:hypothetical protein